MAVNFSGKWKEAREENKEEIMEAMGVPAEMRQKYASERETLEIAHDGDNISSKAMNETGKITMENNFKIGVPFTPKLPEGLPSVGELISTWEEGGKVLHTKSTKDAKVPTTDMKIENGELVYLQKLGQVTSKIYYAKV